MTAARLSPAASLLRNSKLFALPPSLALPSTAASSEPVVHSDTATTPYPIYAAIETPPQSLQRGDWGLKRALPLKSTTKTGTPVIRIRRGLDTPEHTVDFESAADHVLTLQKWQQLNMPVQHPRKLGAGQDDQTHGVFHSSDDNTTNIAPLGRATKIYTGIWPDIDPVVLRNDLKIQSENLVEEGKAAMVTLREEADLRGIDIPEQLQPRTCIIKAQKRWRYAGPWLAGMTGMEFDDFLKKQVRGHAREAAFRRKVESHIVAERLTAAKAKSMEEGRTAESKLQSSKVTDEEYDNYIRALRRKPNIFGPLIAEIFDLPDGPRPKETSDQNWEYGRQTSATPLYKDSGPPQTHPSCGLSYMRSRSYASNDSVYGPQNKLNPVVARVLKNVRSGGPNISPTAGVAGFVAPYLDARATDFQPTPGGQKMLVTPKAAMVNVDGKLDLHVEKSPGDYLIEDDMPVRRSDEEETKQPPRGYGTYGRQVMPMIDSIQNSRFGSSDIQRPQPKAYQPGILSPAETRSAQVRPPQARPTQARPTQARPTQARPTQANTSGHSENPEVLQWLNRLTESARKGPGAR